MLTMHLTLTPAEYKNLTAAVLHWQKMQQRNRVAAIQKIYDKNTEPALTDTELDAFVDKVLTGVVTE